MSKELLKEAKRALKEIEFIENQGDFKQGGIAKAYFTEKYGEILIEQAERVQELESHITKMAVARYKDSEELDDIHKQNKRYREVLERISKHDAYEIDIFVAGKMADEALEGDPHESS